LQSAGSTFPTVARRSIASARQTLAFVRTRYERGLTNESDVALAERVLDALDYWLMQARLWVADEVCDPEG
jgi:outer membrane protein TolC